MKIVIDMPDDEYEVCLSHRESIENMIRVHKCFSLEYAVIRGTPLPKGHGRLIDADEYESDVLSIREPDLDKMLEYLADSPTIIEADTESKG